MSFTIISFSTIRLSVSDVAKSKDWYRLLFNLEPVVDTAHFVQFDLNGTFFDITPADEKSPYSAGGSVGYWLADDLEELVKRITDLGGKIHRGPMQVPDIKRTILQAQDPFGNVIGFEVPF
jgi:predicted enzyme related to lactoylglutathione lyase